MGGDDMKVEQTSPSTDDAPMESSEDAPMAGEGEDDQTAGETGIISDTAATGDGDGDGDVDGDVDDDRSTVAPDENENDEDDNESKSVSTTTNNTAPDENDEDEEESKSVGSTAPDEEEETKSVGTSATLANENDNNENENENDTTTTTNEAALASPESASAPPAAVVAPPPKKKRGKPQIPASARKGRAPAVKGLNIPFRTVKKAMKLDPDIPIVQNEAAIMTTLAAELFLKRLANQSQKICKNRGKNTIRYEDVADARANDPSLAFLKTIIP